VTSRRRPRYDREASPSGVLRAPGRRGPATPRPRPRRSPIQPARPRRAPSDDHCRAVRRPHRRPDSPTRTASSACTAPTTPAPASTTRGLRARAVRDERPPDSFDTATSARPRPPRCSGRVPSECGRRPAGRTRLGRVDSRRRGCVGSCPGANIDVYEAPNNTFGSVDEYAQIVNDDVDPNRHHELGTLRAGGAAGLAGHPAGREPHLPAGGRPGADHSSPPAGTRAATTAMPSSRGHPSTRCCRRRPVQPAVRRGCGRHPDQRRHPSRERAGLERRRPVGRGGGRHLRVLADPGWQSPRRCRAARASRATSGAVTAADHGGF